MELQYQIHGQKDIGSTFLHLEQIIRVLFSSLIQYQKSTRKQLIWSYRGQHNQVEEEHNISLKDSSKKLIRNPFTPLLLQENTQLILHKQYNRENFF